MRYQPITTQYPPPRPASTTSPAIGNDLAKYAQDFLRKLWITKGIRYASANRLELKDRLASLAVATLSIYVITSSLIELLLRCSNQSTDLFPLLTIIAPVFILVISQYETAKRYLVRAQRMHRSAQEIEHMHNCLKLSLARGESLSEVLENIQNKYEQILRDSSANHNEADYARFKSLHPGAYETDKIMKWIDVYIRGRLVYWYDVFFWPALLTLVPGLILIKLIYESLLKLPSGL